MSKGGSQTQSQQMPKFLEDAAKYNLGMAREAGKVGYMPYYGPDVAALSPQQVQSMRNTFDAQQSYGMVAPDAQFSTGMPEPQQFAGGVSGYSSGNLFDRAVAELAARDPEKAAQYGKVFEVPYGNEKA